MADPVILIAPADHPWSRRGEITTGELFEADYILREPESGTYQAVHDALAGIGLDIKDLKTLLTLGNSEAIALSVQEGLVAGFVSQIVVTKLKPGRVEPIRIKELEIQRDIQIGRNTRRQATTAQDSFLEFIMGMEIPLEGLIPENDFKLELT